MSGAAWPSPPKGLWMNLTMDTSAAAIHRVLAMGDHDRAFDMAAARMNEMPGDASAWQLMALVTQLAADPQTTVQILREIVARFPTDQFAVTMLIMELGAQARSVADLAEVEQLVASDFFAETVVSNVLRLLLTQESDEPVRLYFEVDGVQFTWPLWPAHAGYDLLYQHLPWAHNSPGSVDRFYNEFDRYEANQLIRMNRISPLIGQAAAFAPGDRVLDAGCGSGHILAYLVETFAVQPFGVDLSERAGVIARRLIPHIDFRVCQLDSLPYESGFFDRVVCSDVLEHVRRPWLLAAELARVCRAGGELVISVPDGRYDDFIGHINFFSTQSLETMLEVHGDVRISTHVDGLVATVTMR
jgi:hypothetical protein